MRRTRLHTLRTASDADTERYGAALGARIHRGLAICLTGPLGAGKTVLVRGICRGLGVTGDIVSPTFILMEMMRGNSPGHSMEIAHIDLYRLEHERELEEIGVFDMLGGDTVVLAEWGDRSPALLDAADVVIHIEPAADGERTIVVEADADAAAQLGDAA
jgi:tRNA threonylcarbamoyladenosine biosynthesis protein TsaE